MRRVTVLDALLDSPVREAESRKLKCPKCDAVQSASNSKCTNCGHDLADARKAKFANLSEGFDDALHPRDWHGRWTRAPGGKRYETEHRGHSMRIVAQNTAAGGPRWKATYKNPRGEERIVAKGDDLKRVRADAATHFRAVTKRPTPIVPPKEGRDGYKVGDRLRVKGRGEEGGVWKVTQAHPASPHVELTSERSGRTQRTPASELGANFERVGKRSELARSYDEGRKAQSARAEILAKSPGAANELRTYNDVKAAAQNPGQYRRSQDGEIAPDRPVTAADHRRAGAHVDSPEVKARDADIHASVRRAKDAAKAAGKVEDKYGRLRHPDDIPPSERKARTPKQQERFDAANRRAQGVAQDRHRRLENERVTADEEKARQVETIQREYRTAGEAVTTARATGDPKVIRRAEQRWAKAKDGLRNLTTEQRAAYTRARPNAFK